MNSFKITNIALWTQYMICTWTPPEWLLLDYGIITALSRTFKLNDSCCTMESSSHSHVNFTWINGSSWTVEWPQMFSWTPPEWLIFEDEIAVAFSRELLPNSPCCTIDSSEHSVVTSSCMTHVGLRNHELRLNSSCWTIKSIQHSFLNSSWISHFWRLNRRRFLKWTLFK